MTKVIKPTTYTSAMLVSTTAQDVDAAYNAGTAYALNARCTYADRIYGCIQGPSTGNDPATSPLWWIDAGPSNKSAMFDNQISTATTATTSLAVVLEPGLCNSISFFGLVGQTLTVNVKDGPSGATVFERTFTLDGTLIADWYQYFYEPFVQLGEVVITDLPAYSTNYMTITITAGVGASVGIGMVSFGTIYELGSAQYGATASIIDYSRKDTSALGVATFIKRSYSKRMSLHLVLPNAQLNKVQRILADIRATPCAWIGSGSSDYLPLVMFGFYRDFSIEIAYATTSFCSIEIEGLSQ